MPVIGFLHHASPDGFALLDATFRQGLKEIGFIEGRNVRIGEYHSGEITTIGYRNWPLIWFIAKWP